MREVLFIREGPAASEGGNLVSPLGEEHPDWGAGWTAQQRRVQRRSLFGGFRPQSSVAWLGRMGQQEVRKLEGSQRGHQSSGTCSLGD